MTVTACGNSAVAAVLNPVKPSMATTSIPSRHAWGRADSQAWKALVERPWTMSRSRAGPTRSRTGVRSMMTVTYLSPVRVWRQTCSSTPITRTPSKRDGSEINSRLPSASTASFAVSHATPSAPAIRATLRWPTTSASSAHVSARRDNLALGAAAPLVS